MAGIDQDIGSDDPRQPLTCAAEVLHDTDSSSKGPAEGKAAADGIGIGIPVAEVEDVFVPADAIAELTVADEHGLDLEFEN